jgi:hypothetical protein
LNTEYEEAVELWKDEASVGKRGIFYFYRLLKVVKFDRLSVCLRDCNLQLTVKYQFSVAAIKIEKPPDTPRTPRPTDQATRLSAAVHGCDE